LRLRLDVTGVALLELASLVTVDPGRQEATRRHVEAVGEPKTGRAGREPLGEAPGPPDGYAGDGLRRGLGEVLPGGRASWRRGEPDGGRRRLLGEVGAPGGDAGRKLRYSAEAREMAAMLAGVCTARG
jgi:hypothetical protein